MATIGNKTISQLTQGANLEATDVFPADKSRGDTVKYSMQQIENVVKKAIYDAATDLTGSIHYLAYNAGLEHGNLLKMDGRSVLVADYPELHNRIGYEWGGSGDSFSLPNHSDRFAGARSTQLNDNYLDDQIRRTTYTVNGTDLGNKTTSNNGDHYHGGILDHVGENKVYTVSSGPTWTTNGKTNNSGEHSHTTELGSHNHTVEIGTGLVTRPKTIAVWAYIQSRKF